MEMRKAISEQTKSISSILLTLILFVFALVNLSFDYIHEGVNIASTLAIKNGQVVHRDILELKGIIFPYFMSFFSDHYSFSIVEFKVINVFLISVNAFLIYFLARLVDEILARLFVILWLLCNPAIANYTFGNSHGVLMLSPNNLSVALILLTVYLFVFMNQKSRLPEDFRFLTIGFVLGLLPWVRIQNVFFVLGIILFLVYSRRFPKARIFHFTAIFTVSISCPFVFLIFRHAVQDWFTQIFYFPWKLSQLDDAAVYISPNTLLKTFLVSLFFTFLSILVVGIANYSALHKRMLIITLVSSGPLTLWISHHFLIQEGLRFHPRNWTIILSNNWPTAWARVLLVIVVIKLIVVGLMILRKGLQGLPSKQDLVEKKILNNFGLGNFGFPGLLAGIQAILFLYPNFGNLWEMTPLLILSVISIISTYKAKTVVVIKPLLGALAIGFFIAGLFSLTNIMKQEKFFYSTAILQGIYETDKDKVQNLDKALSIIKKTEGPILNECGIALFAFRDSDFDSVTPYYLNLSYRRVIPHSRWKPQVVIRCSNQTSFFDLDEYTLLDEVKFGEENTIYIYSRKR